MARETSMGVHGAILRQIEVQIAQGKGLALACKEAAIPEQSYGTTV
ncbi:hypothetical protein [Methylobacterium sp. CM6257]